MATSVGRINLNESLDLQSLLLSCDECGSNQRRDHQYFLVVRWSASDMMGGEMIWAREVIHGLVG